jgi:hypothetical protein
MKIIQTYNDFINEGFLTKNSNNINSSQFNNICNIVEDIFKEYKFDFDDYDNRYFTDRFVALKIIASYKIYYSSYKELFLDITIFKDRCDFFTLKKDERLTIYTLDELKKSLLDVKNFINYDYYKDLLVDEKYNTLSSFDIMNPFNGKPLIDRNEFKLSDIIYLKEYDKEYNDMILYVCKNKKEYLKQVKDISKNLNKETFDQFEVFINASNFDLI